MKKKPECSWCGKLINTHKRCKMCEILLHKKDSSYVHNSCAKNVQHSLMSPNRKHCKECYDSFINNK